MHNFYFVRHGETLANVENKIQGQSDASLTENGKDMIENLALELKSRDLQFDLVYSSNQKRAIETKDIILKTLANESIVFHADAGLREWEFGTFDGQDIEETFSNLKKLKLQNLTDGEPSELTLKEVANVIFNMDKSGQAESWEVLKDRVWSSFSSIVSKATASGAKNVLIVSHGLTISTLLYIIDKDRDKFKNISNGSIVVVSYEEGMYKVS
ncbi:histidine phosphatase family protein [Paenibacillus sp. PR3]|uniref:phosphoglycerate mutase (2,3-diphosphoglycerate-dependent) n=1 Tax=Paenibacillus terricola TaxID=2763503 RepID=A0ABR8N207_9BACL|nr:histidine phosphatase family protein [Paenibacillus terricola]MBD3922211.1 histidine phosphatase family protein [Paenibacillus terricola]